MAQVIPRYTLCTSLGQLVNHRRVNETLAQYKLDEALRKNRCNASDERIDKALSRESLNTCIIASAATSNHSEQDLGVHNNTTPSNIPTSDANVIPISPTNPEALPPNISIKPARMLRRGSSVESSDSEKMAKLAELVQTRTADLPSLLPEINKKSRRSRKKAHSDGVALMANLKEMTNRPPIEIYRDIPRSTSSVDIATRSSLAPPPPPAIRNGRYGPRVKSVSANVALMQSPASSMYALPSTSASFASEGKEEESAPALPPLLEGIPARSNNPSDLTVPVGRTSTETSPMETPASSKVVRVIAPPLDKNDKNEENGKTSQQRKSSNGTSGWEGHNIKFGQNSTAPAEGENRQLGVTSAIPYARVIQFLRSRTYRLISGVFGTMLVFFVIGMRIEAFLIETGVMPDSKNTWQ